MALDHENVDYEKDWEESARVMEALRRQLEADAKKPREEKRSSPAAADPVTPPAPAKAPASLAPKTPATPSAKMVKTPAKPIETPAKTVQETAKTAEIRAKAEPTPIKAQPSPAMTPVKTVTAPAAPQKTPQTPAIPVKKTEAVASQRGEAAPVVAPARKEAPRHHDEVTVQDLMRDLFETGGKAPAPQEKNAPPQKQQPAPDVRENKGREGAPRAGQTVPEAIRAMRESAGTAPKDKALTPSDEARAVARRWETRAPVAPHKKEQPAPPKKDNTAQMDLFASIAASAAAQEEESENGRPVSGNAADFSEDKLQLLLGLDYEDELGNVIGFHKIRRYYERDINGEESAPRAEQHLEYENANEGMWFRKSYAGKKRGYLFRFVYAVAFLILLFFYEHPSWPAAWFGGIVDGGAYPASYILIGLQLLIFAAAFSYRRLWNGLKKLLRFTPSDTSFCSAMFLFTFLYHIVLLFLPHAGYPALYLSPAAASLALLSLNDLLNWYRESLAFQVVSSGNQKYALLPRVSVGGDQHDARRRLTQESGDDERVLYVCPVDFVRNYFLNTRKKVAHQRSLVPQLLLIVAIGVSLGLYVFATGGSAEKTWQMAFVTFLLSVPATSLLVTSVPMFLAACLRLKKNAAVIGEVPIDRCGGKHAIVLSDCAVFGGMRHEHFEWTENAEKERDSAIIRALLEKIGSPLAEAVDASAEKVDIELLAIEERGVTARATILSPKGKEEKKQACFDLFFGSAEYMKKHHVAIEPRGLDLEELRRKLLCVSVDGKVRAFFLADYKTTSDLTPLFDELEAENVRVMIRTKDPGVNDGMLHRIFGRRGSAVLTMRATAREEDIGISRVDAGIVSLGSPLTAARAFAVARQIRRAGVFGKCLGGLSVGVGILFAVLLAYFGGFSALSPFVVTVYMLFWCAVHALFSYIRLRERPAAAEKE